MLVQTFSGCFSEHFSIHTLSCGKDSGILFIVNISSLIKTLYCVKESQVDECNFEFYAELAATCSHSQVEEGQ